MAVELRGQSLIKHHLWKSVGIVVVCGYVCEVTPNGDCPMPNPALLSTSVDIFCLSSEKQVKECGRWEPRSAGTTVLKCSLWFYITGQLFDLQIVHIKIEVNAAMVYALWAMSHKGMNGICLNLLSSLMVVYLDMIHDLWELRSWNHDRLTVLCL
jgi:hypothetical protein